MKTQSSLVGLPVSYHRYIGDFDKSEYRFEEASPAVVWRVRENDGRHSPLVDILVICANATNKLVGRIMIIPDDCHEPLADHCRYSMPPLVYTFPSISADDKAALEKAVAQMNDRHAIMVPSHLCFAKPIIEKEEKFASEIMANHVERQIENRIGEMTIRLLRDMGRIGVEAVYVTDAEIASLNRRYTQGNYATLDEMIRYNCPISLYDQEQNIVAGPERLVGTLILNPAKPEHSEIIKRKLADKFPEYASSFFTGVDPAQEGGDKTVMTARGPGCGCDILELTIIGMESGDKSLEGVTFKMIAVPVDPQPPSQMPPRDPARCPSMGGHFSNPPSRPEGQSVESSEADALFKFFKGS